MHETAILAAAENAAGLGEVAPWANVTAVVMNMLILVWLITKRGPQERDEYRKDLTETRLAFEAELKAERASREAMAAKFAELIAENREAAHEQANRFMSLVTEYQVQSHNQRSEDRQTYRDSMRTMLQEFIAAVSETKHV